MFDNSGLDAFKKQELKRVIEGQIRNTKKTLELTDKLISASPNLYTPEMIENRANLQLILEENERELIELNKS